MLMQPLLLLLLGSLKITAIRRSSCYIMNDSVEQKLVNSLKALRDFGTKRNEQTA